MNWFDILALVANVASLIGLALTLLVYRSVKRLQEHYTLIGRVPEVAKRLDELTLQLAQQLPQQSSTTAQRQELIKTLSQMIAALEAIGRNIGAGEGAAEDRKHKLAP